MLRASQRSFVTNACFSLDPFRMTNLVFKFLERTTPQSF